MFRELFITILLITVTLPLIHALPGDISDNPIEISEGIHNGFLAENDSVWYSINLTGNYIFTLDADIDTDFDLFLYDSNVLEVDLSVRSTYPDIITSYSYYGAHLLEIRSWSGSGNFTLNVSSFPVIQGDNERNPIEILDNGTIGIFDGTSEFFWYNVTLSGNYNIKLVGDDLTDFDLYMYDQELNIIDQSWGPTYPKRIDLYSFYGSALIKIKATSGEGSFILSITSFPLVAGDSPDNPIQLSNNMTFSSRLPFISGEDPWVMWFSIEIDGYQRFILDARTDLDLYLYTLDLYQIDKSTTIFSPEILTTEELVGTFLLEVYSYDLVEDSFDLITQEVGNTAGSSFDMAIPIETGNITGMVPGPALDQSIWYKISVDGNYSLSLYGDDGLDLEIYVYDSNYDLFISATTYDNPENITLMDVHGNYYIRIISNYMKLGGFNLFYQVKTEIIDTNTPVDPDTDDKGFRGFMADYGIPLTIAVFVIASYLIMARKNEVIRPKKIKQNISNKLKSRKVEGSICLTCGTFNMIGAVFCVECGATL